LNAVPLNVVLSAFKYINLTVLPDICAVDRALFNRYCGAISLERVALRPSLIDGAAADVGGPLLAGGRLDGVPGEADVARGQVGAVVGDHAGGMAAPAGSANQVVV